FWAHLGDRFAAVQKAAYLALKKGDPQALVLQASLSSGVTPFARDLFESGIAPYFDVFNWHIYQPPSQYPENYSDYAQLLRQFGAGDKPSWVTEAGIRLK